MCLFQQMDPDGPWKEAAHKLAHAYDRLMINKGDNESYLFSTWMYPGRPVEKPAVHPFDKYVYLAGTQAWIAQYLAIYDRALHDPAATKLAERMMNYNMFDREVNEPNGQFQPGPGVGTGPLEGQYAHFHTHATNILACVYVYMQTGNRALLDRAIKSYEYGKSKGEPLIGFFPMVTYNKYIGAQTAETCQVAAGRPRPTRGRWWRGCPCPDTETEGPTGRAAEPAPPEPRNDPAALRPGPHRERPPLLRLNRAHGPCRRAHSGWLCRVACGQ